MYMGSGDVNSSAITGALSAPKSLSAWYSWCRLCAKENAQDYTKEQQVSRVGRNHVKTDLILVAAIRKYFSVDIAHNSELPETICTDCSSYVIKLLNFTECVTKVQQMFCKIKSGDDDMTVDLHAIRLKFGLLVEDREPVLMPEVHYFDEKPKTHELLEKMFEAEPSQISTDPLIIKEEITEYTQQQQPHPHTELETTVVKEEKESDIEGEPELLQQQQTTLKQQQITRKRKCSIYQKQSKVKPNKRLTDNKSAAPKGDDAVSKNISTKHQKKLKKAEFDCSQCKRVYYTQHELDTHAKIHIPTHLKKTLPCPYCEKKLCSETLVQAHIKNMHLNERPFICEKCGFGQLTESALKVHMLAHTTYAPFECQVCKKSFKDNSRLRNHMEIHNPQKYVCPECGLQLNSRPTLNRHLVVHSDQMEHKCDYCGRAFKRAKSLKSHLILHTGLKPYSCDFCDQTFASVSNCRTHKKKVHPDELAALEAAGGSKSYTRNIPNLAALKAVARAADNLTPVVSKQSGCFAFGKKPKNTPRTSASKQHISGATNDNNGGDNSCARVPTAEQSTLPEPSDSLRLWTTFIATP